VMPALESCFVRHASADRVATALAAAGAAAAARPRMPAFERQPASDPERAAAGGAPAAAPAAALLARCPDLPRFHPDGPPAFALHQRPPEECSL